MRQRFGASDVQEVRFKLSRRQLADTGEAELYYMLMAWVWGRWSFVLLPQRELAVRKTASERRQPIRGGIPRPDHVARSDDLTLTLCFSRDAATGSEDVTEAAGKRLVGRMGLRATDA